MPLHLLEIILALLALFNAGAGIRKVYKSFTKGEWDGYSRRLKTAYVASIFTSFGWLLLFAALQRSSQLLPVLVIAILYYFLVTGPTSRELSLHKIKEAIHLTAYKNLIIVTRLVEKTWELSGYRCRHELDWTKQDDNSITASWSRKPGQTIIYCTFFQNNSHSEPAEALAPAASSAQLNEVDDYLSLSMDIVMAMSYTHERPCLQKAELRNHVREYFISDIAPEQANQESIVNSFD